MQARQAVLQPFEELVAPQAETAKQLGAYYTSSHVADFLASWAIRHPTDRVLDPCFGGGVFLRAASRRFVELNGNPTSQILGVEIDADTFNRIGKPMIKGRHLQNLRNADFFSVDPGALGEIDAIIGNPPFIRYQRFGGDQRKKALARSAIQGVNLPALSSSWAPFLVHCIALLRSSGRLAMVVPGEVGHAKYALPLLEHIRKSFESVTFLTFRTRLFPELSEDTLLLLADGKGNKHREMLHRDFESPTLLNRALSKGGQSLARARRLDSTAVASGKQRLIEQQIPARARALYRELKSSARVCALSEIADVGIGYVTGSNSFFHLSKDDVDRLEVPSDCLKPVVKRGRAFTGLRFSSEDWREGFKRHDSAFLLHLSADKVLPKQLLPYLESGKLAGIASGYKCRNRSPWYCVPHVYQPDAFLTYMSGVTPRLVANDANVFAPNNLHVVRIRPESKISADSLAAFWQSSLTRLSVEIEGHPLGGGMLKLEPTEAGAVLLPCIRQFDSSRLFDLTEELDNLLRSGNAADAQVRADQVVLQEFLGLGKNDCRLLWNAAGTLRARRGYKESPYGAA